MIKNPEQGSGNGPEDVHPQEKIIDVPYGELGKGESPISTWGIADYNGSHRNLYWDAEINQEIFTKEITQRTGVGKTVRIADFGGAEGKLIREIIEDLNSQNIKAVGAVVDPQLKQGITREAWDSIVESKKSGEPTQVVGIASEIGGNKDDNFLREESLDVAMSRFVAQYNAGEKLPSFYQDQKKYLKDGGVLISEWPSTTETDEGMVNEFWAQYARISNGTDPQEYIKKQHYHTVDQIRETAEQVGFKVVSCDLVDGLSLEVSEIAMSNGSRFKELDEGQKKELRQLYLDLASQHPDLVFYDIQNDRYYFKMHVGKLVAEKVGPDKETA
jgi:hypothetical protein